MLLEPGTHVGSVDDAEGSFVPGEQELYGVSLELSQPLFTWGKVSAAVDLAQHSANEPVAFGAHGLISAQPDNRPSAAATASTTAGTSSGKLANVTMCSIL